MFLQTELDMRKVACLGHALSAGPTSWSLGLALKGCVWVYSTRMMVVGHACTVRGLTSQGSCILCVFGLLGEYPEPASTCACGAYISTCTDPQFTETTTLLRMLAFMRV